jgi:hypothetical protein
VEEEVEEFEEYMSNREKEGQVYAITLKKKSSAEHTHKEHPVFF